MNTSMTLWRTILFTSIALLAFAGNSVLCRLALGEQSIDAGSFTVIRLLSGIITLTLLWYFSGMLSEPKSKHKQVAIPAGRGSWSAALMLFIYAITFSYAYISLDTGTGALILFGAVQITMILVNWIKGGRLRWPEWLGLFLAFGGFVYLLAPLLSTPSVSGFLLMTASGIAWGLYTLKGRSSQRPLADTHFNFLRTLPLLLISMLFLLDSGYLTVNGIVLAVLSGSLASGVGYAIWYLALNGLSAVQAAVLQLLVPVIAALGGVVFAAEEISLRLIIASLMVLGGILLVVLGRYYLSVLSAEKETGGDG
ncbi:DMT family transporter [Amphritea balenae]|uniref:DMT family transporter n=1 Tax=Amphritea balenae TaxID=452629 RepID=UPI001997CBC0|nr:DMT family transporter [Amphritea balenae]GGK70291.1 hypothetical protein GCM10007941_20680 [Amphritea balenae]